MDSDHRSRKATDLQSAPFDRSGTPPDMEPCWKAKLLLNWSWQTDLNPRPADYKSLIRNYAIFLGVKEANLMACTLYFLLGRIFTEF